MEDSVVRLIKTIILILIMSTAAPNLKAEEACPNDISAYYGFDEMEIIKLDWHISDLRVSDFNGDGRNDIAVVNNRKAKIELLIQKKQITAAEDAVIVAPEDIDVNILRPPTRFARESIAVAQKITSFLCRDLNSDGMPDVAFYGEPKGLYVILQKEKSAEDPQKDQLSWQPRKKIEIDDGLTITGALVCADLNNDGKNDLALAGNDKIYVILQNEDGSLAEPVSYPTIDRIKAVKVGDLNADGIGDLVLVTNNKEKPVCVRFGLETGQLGPQVRLFIESPWAVRLAEIDGQPGREILTIDYRSKRLSCYKLSPDDREDADWPILFYPLASGQQSADRDIAIGDIDGDDLADIVISDPVSAELLVFKQRKNTGLAEEVRFPALADIKSLSAADIDGDGKTELAVLSAREKIIGITEFEKDRLSFPKSLDLIGRPSAMELGDLDGDGGIDCIYVSSDSNDTRYVKVIYDIGSTETAKPHQADSNADGQTDGNRLPLQLENLAADPEGLKILDVDGDGLNDILIFVKYELPILVHQNKTKTFEIIEHAHAQMSLIKDATLSSTAVADVDWQKDGRLLVAQKNFARNLVFADGQKWTVVDQYNAKSRENKISSVAAFNIDYENETAQPAVFLLDAGKGQLQILKTGTDGIYRFEKQLNVGRWNTATHLKMAFAPLTGNETGSILLFDGEKFALITPPKAGNRPLYLQRQFIYETKIKDGRYGDMTSGDINSDGRNDIIMVEYNQNHIEILTLDSVGRPIPAMRFKIFEQKSYSGQKRPAPTVEPRQMEVADVTGDGKDDLVTIIHDRIIIYPQD